MERHSQKHKAPFHLLARPRVHHLRSSWHAVDRELEGSLVMRTPFRRKICTSGAYRGTMLLFPLQSIDDSNKAAFFTQWLPQSQIVRPNFPSPKAMEASTRDGHRSLWCRNVSTHPISLSFLPPSRPLLFPREAELFLFY